MRYLFCSTPPTSIHPWTSNKNLQRGGCVSIVATLVKRIGVGGLFMMIVAAISDLLGLTGDRDLMTIAKEIIMQYKEFFLGVFIGFVAFGFTKNFYIGIIAAVITIFVLYAIGGIL